jgi:hypothetical protein
MPTGYTYSIKEGISFRDFTLSCSKAFGALISMRDEPNDAPIPTEIKPSDYALKSLNVANAQLKKLNEMSISVAEILCEKEYQDELKRIEKSEKEDSELYKKYEEMLDKVNKWTPPTSEHQGLKDFMIQQIESSIKHDCRYKREKPTKIKASEWLANRKKQAMKDIEYYKKSYKEEVERCAEKTKWIQDLVKSLEE